MRKVNVVSRLVSKVVLVVKVSNSNLISVMVSVVSKDCSRKVIVIRVFVMKFCVMIVLIVVLVSSVDVLMCCGVVWVVVGVVLWCF